MVGFDALMPDGEAITSGACLSRVASAHCDAGVAGAPFRRSGADSRRVIRVADRVPRLAVGSSYRAKRARRCSERTARHRCLRDAVADALLLVRWRCTKRAADVYAADDDRTAVSDIAERLAVFGVRLRAQAPAGGHVSLYAYVNPIIAVVLARGAR